MLAEITPLLLTYNEAPNIRRSLDMLGWASRIVIIDSGSTDGTLEMLADYPQVECIHRVFDDHSTQWNFGLDQVKTQWVLALDADYVLSGTLLTELEALPLCLDFAAYFAPFKFCIHGRLVRGNLYPPRAVLFRRESCHYVQDGHTQRLSIDGPVDSLRGVIFHDDRKSLRAWLEAQARYADLEVQKLIAVSVEALSWPDRLRSWIVPAPFLVFFYTLFAKGLIFDGWAGWFYVLQRTVAELILSLALLEARLKNFGDKQK